MPDMPRQYRSGEGDIIDLLDQLQSTVSEAKGLPFSDNCIVDRQDVLYWINQIRDALPEEVRQARWIVEQNRQVVASARQKAESILRESEQQSAMMIDEHEITQQARRYANETVNEANDEADSIQAAAISYTEQRLTLLEDQLTQMLVTVRGHKKDLHE